MIINVVMGHQSDSAIAAMAAFRVCEGFVYAFFGGLANASSVAVGNEVGAGNLDRGLSYAKRAALVCPAITFTIVLIMTLLHNPLFGLFGLGESRAGCLDVCTVHDCVWCGFRLLQHFRFVVC